MDATVVLEWTYAPPDFFEQQTTITDDDYMVTIANGKVEARIDSAVFDQKPSLKEALTDLLIDHFWGTQLADHRTYDLSPGSLSRVYSDGRRDVTVNIPTEVIRITEWPVDVVITDGNENIVGDSRRDRLGRKKDLAELVRASRPKDKLVASLLQSYKASIDDPGNELMHLYEIRDALQKRFGGQKAAYAALGLSRRDWSRLGRLANDEPLRQGRHRGKKMGQLRDATPDELKEAQEIAVAMIEGYLKYVQRH
jgi:hypothetical protein